MLHRPLDGPGSSARRPAFLCSSARTTAISHHCRMRRRRTAISATGDGDVMEKLDEDRTRAASTTASAVASRAPPERGSSACDQVACTTHSIAVHEMHGGMHYILGKERMRGCAPFLKWASASSNRRTFKGKVLHQVLHRNLAISERASEYLPTLRGKRLQTERIPR